MLAGDELADRILSPETDHNKQTFQKFIQDGHYDLVLSFATGGSDIVYPHVPSGSNSIFSRFASFMDRPQLGEMSENCPITPARMHQTDALQRITNMFYNIYRVPMLTIKLNCCKMPKTSEIGMTWRRNFHKIMSFLWLTETGVKGHLNSALETPVRNAIIKLAGPTGIQYEVSKNQAYFKIVLPAGDVQLEILADGFKTKKLSLQMVEGKVLDLGMVLMEKITDNAAVQKEEIVVHEIPSIALPVKVVEHNISGIFHILYLLLMLFNIGVYL